MITRYALMPPMCLMLYKPMDLTPGRRYLVRDWHKARDTHYFSITDDTGFNLLCREEECFHIGQADWIILEVKATWWSRLREAIATWWHK